jgi:hypothetical protein
LVGIAAIVASLIFVGVQLRQDGQIAEAERLATEQILDLEISRFIDERRDVWRKGLAGEELSADDQVSFDVIAFALFRQQANENRSSLLLRGTSPDNLVESYALFVYLNPGLRAWFDELVEIRAYSDRTYGRSDDLRYFPLLVSEQLQHLDDTGLPSHDPYPLPY